MKIDKSMLPLIPIFSLILLTIILIASIGSRAITTLAENAPITDRKCVIIDAGHGGVDGGATSCTGKLESMINLEIAIRLNDLLHLIGTDTHMIRTTDCSVYTEGENIAAKKVSDLKERLRIANSTENAYLISIHQNYFADSRYSGAQVFYAATAQSEELAKEMQTTLVNTLNTGSNRKTKKANGIYLLEKIQCPGILIECGFLSNPQEEAMLRNDTYQKKLCVVIATTLNSYLNRNRSA